MIAVTVCIHKVLYWFVRNLFEPFDYLIYWRTFEKITEDVVERPEQIKELCEIIGEYEIVRAMAKSMQAGAGEVPGVRSLSGGLSGRAGQSGVPQRARALRRTSE